MKATFTNVVRYQVEAVCQTPLRIGGADGDTELVLRNWQGLPMIQGTALAGALRSWLTEIGEGDLADEIFGSKECGGHLIVSDGIFEACTKSTIRPRLRIDGFSGSADPTGKFDMAHICTGAEFHFDLTLLCGDTASDEITAVEQMLSALNSGEIQLGAQKANGFGRVSVSVKKQAYNLQNAEDRSAWLEDRENGQPLDLPSVKRRNRVVFTLRGNTDSLLVKGATAEHSDKGSYIRNIQEAGKPVIPGSAVKGAGRARISLIARQKGLPDSLVEELFGRQSQKKDNGLAGKLRFEDVQMSSEYTQKITRIRINRFTGGVIQQGLFREEPVCSKLCLRVIVPAECHLGCGLLTYALRDLALGLYNLGSGDAIGRGRILVESIQIEAPDAEKAYIAFDADRNCKVTDPSGVIAGWMRELEVHE